MEENHEKPKKSRTTLVVLLVMLPLLYVLSVGPATKLLPGISRSGGQIFMRFYRPLIWIGREVRWIQKPLSDYINYWQKL